MSETVTAHALDDDNEFTGDHHVYEPFKVGLPKLKPYFDELWRRRGFLTEASRATLRATQANTVIGQLWAVLNPLLLGLVYFMLIYILSGQNTSPTQFAHLLAGLFLFYFIQGSMTGGASSVVGAGKMIVNTAFPRLLLPLAAVRTAFRRFWPTLIVLFLAMIGSGVGVSPVQLLAIPWFIIAAIFAGGLAMIMATLQLYFRDTASFLPYFTRIWLYISPVLWYADKVPHRLQFLEVVNPLFSICGGWSQILIEKQVPDPSTWLVALAWALGSLLLGGYYFMSRERDFAVRL